LKADLLDIVTQGLLGAALAQSAAPAREVRAAAMIGMAAGVLPDIDALVTSSSDPLLVLEWHRYFTHSLLFIPVGALVAALLLAPLFARRLGALRLYGYAFLGYALSGLLDACTSYGTALLWPFSDHRVAWNIISIVDPVFSASLLIGVGLAWYVNRARSARVALALCAAYLCLGWIGHERAMDRALQVAAERGHEVSRLVVKPTFANILLWRSIYISDQQVFADGHRVPITGASRHYPGQSLPLVTAGSLGEWGASSTLAVTDFERFSRFSDDFVVRSPRRQTMLGDARFAMLPTKLKPLWGIEMLPEDTGHARFVTQRELTESDRDRFVSMLLGRD
jgi:inner membrane protein